MKAWMFSVCVAIALVLGLAVGWSGTVQTQESNPLQGPVTITVVDAGACATAGACAMFPWNNYVSGALEVSTAFTGTLVPEVLVQSIWVTMNVTDSTGALVASITAPGVFSLANTGYSRVRLRASALSAGTPVVYFRQGYSHR